MRDPNRIPLVLAALGESWAAHPNLRLGQLLGNLGVGYFTEDDVTLKGLAGECAGCGRPLEAANCCYLDPDGCDLNGPWSGDFGHYRQCCDCYDKAFTGHPEEEM